MISARVSKHCVVQYGMVMLLILVTVSMHDFVNSYVESDICFSMFGHWT